MSQGHNIIDRRGKRDGNDSKGFTDDEIVAMMGYACRANGLPIPKSVLMSEGIHEARIEALFKAGRINRVPVQDKTRNIAYHYYPASFEAYMAPRTPPDQEDVKTEQDT